MLIIPGFAIPACTNLYNFILNNYDIQDLMDLFENFYLNKNGNFFIILIIQQTCFGFLGSINQIKILFDFYLSPSIFLKIRKNKDLRKYFKRERYTFEISDNYSRNLVILGIIIIYR